MSIDADSSGFDRSCHLGIEIGGTKIQVVIGRPDGRILDRRRYRVDLQRGAEGIRGQIEEAIAELRRNWQPERGVVGFGGPVDHRRGRVMRSHQVKGWSGFDLRSWLETVSGLPFRADNDANLAAFGEARCGAGRGLNPVFYVTLGSGVGGGLVVDGRIYHGDHPGESELGHVRLDREGTIVEERCSGWAVDARIRKLAESGGGGMLARLVRESPEGGARHLGAALEAGDPVAFHLLNEVAEDLSFALSHMVHLMHPQGIVLGGGLSLIGEPFRAEVARLLPGLLMKVFGEGPQVRLASLGEDAVPVGCLVLAGVWKVAE